MSEDGAAVVIVRQSGAWDAVDAPWIETALAAAQDLISKPEPGTVAVVLADDAEITALNAQFRGQDNPTNVLAFPAAIGPSGGEELGDVVLSWTTLAREAAEREILTAHHVAHLVIHGYLHLQGYTHDDDAEAAVMEGLERRALAAIGVKDPYERHDGDVSA